MSEHTVYNPPANFDVVLDGDDATFSWDPAVAAYPFVNGDAETGDLTGWTPSVSTGAAVVTGGNVHSGTYCWAGVTGTVNSRMRQRISPLCLGLTIADIAAGRDITLDWYGANRDATLPDQPRLNMYFYDEDENLLDSFVPSYKTVTLLIAGVVTWHNFIDTVELPAGTVYVEIEADFLRNNGVGNDALIDDILVQLEGAAALPFVPGYALYIDDVLVGSVGSNIEELEVEGITPGDHTARVRVYDGTNFLSDYSSEIEFTYTPAGSQIVQLVGFNDPELFPILTLMPRINLRDAVCGRRPGAGKRPPSGAMLRSMCSKVKP